MNKSPAALVLWMTVALGLAVPCAAAAAEKVPNPSLNNARSVDTSLLVQGTPIAFWLDAKQFYSAPAARELTEAGPLVMSNLGRVLSQDKSPERRARAAWVMGVIAYRNPAAAEVQMAVPALVAGARCSDRWDIRAFRFKR